jgi:predicted enzyme related to lactoylglutathione lyase
VHWEIASGNGEKLQRFYAELFDWRVDANNPYHYGVVDTGGGGINGGIGPSDGANRVTFYVQVPDLQAALDRAGRLGGKTVMPPTEIPGEVTLAMFADPEGNVIGLIKG